MKTCLFFLHLQAHIYDYKLESDIQAIFIDNNKTDKALSKSILPG